MGLGPGVEPAEYSVEATSGVVRASEGRREVDEKDLEKDQQ